MQIRVSESLKNFDPGIPEELLKINQEGAEREIPASMRSDELAALYAEREELQIHYARQDQLLASFPTQIERAGSDAEQIESLLTKQKALEIAQASLRSQIDAKQAEIVSQTQHDARQELNQQDRQALSVAQALLAELDQTLATAQALTDSLTARKYAAQRAGLKLPVEYAYSEAMDQLRRAQSALRQSVQYHERDIART